MDRPDFQLACDIVDDAGMNPLDGVLVRQLIALALFEAGAGGGEQLEVSVTFAAAEEMAAINEEHRGVTGATDVLSFPIDGLETDIGTGEPRVVGDIVVCPSYVEQQIAAGTTMQDERELAPAVERCIVHGALHLAGFDHERGDGEATEMLALEQLVLERVRSSRA